MWSFLTTRWARALVGLLCAAVLCLTFLDNLMTWVCLETFGYVLEEGNVITRSYIQLYGVGAVMVTHFLVWVLATWFLFSYARWYAGPVRYWLIVLFLLVSIGARVVAIQNNTEIAYTLQPDRVHVWEAEVTEL